MPLKKFIPLAVIGVFLLVVSIFYYMFSQSGQPALAKKHGSSVVVLVDFSRSFAASRREAGGILYGLRAADRHALREVARSVAELATKNWNPPMKMIWAKIQSSSISVNPICAPFETHGAILIKPEGSIGSREDIQAELYGCVEKVMDASTQYSQLSAYTDISGALAAASEISTPDMEKTIIILSDFHEDIPPGAVAANFELHGEQVILLHRPGTDEPPSVRGYIRRIQEWKQKLLENGASSAIALPVFTVTGSRLEASMLPEHQGTGTALTIMVDGKDNVLKALRNSNQREPLLSRIGTSLAQQAQEWPPPVTATWILMSPSGFDSRVMPTIEYFPSLIKRPPALNTVAEFRVAMEEIALNLSQSTSTWSNTDISGSIALTCDIEPGPTAHILILVSDFVEIGSSREDTAFQLIPNTTVVMIHTPSISDRLNPNQYVERRRQWEQRLKAAGAVNVFQFPLFSFTSNDLHSILNQTH